MSEKNEGRVVLCIQCGEVVPYDPSEERAKEKVFDRMKAHDLVCPKNPLVARVAELEADVSNLEQVCNAFFEALSFYANGKNWVPAAEWATLKTRSPGYTLARDTLKSAQNQEETKQCPRNTMARSRPCARRTKEHARTRVAAEQ